MSNIHTLKYIQPYFNQIWLGKKKAEIRKNDRDFKLGDIIYLQEYNKEKNTFSKYQIKIRITDILENFEGIELGYCMFSFDVEERITDELTDILGMTITEIDEI
jgi:hypothetical protein